MSLSKMILCLCVVSVLLRADWDSTDKMNLSTVRGDVEDIKDDLRSYIGDSFSRFNNVTMMGSEGYGVLSPWLLQMAYGVELRPAHVGGSNEHWNLNPNVPTDDYLTAFGLKGGYEDNTLYYLQYINAFNASKFDYGYLENGGHIPIDNWLMYAPQSDIMNTLDKENFDSTGQVATQSGFIYDRVQNSVYEADNIARNVRARLVGIANNSIGGSNYTGDVLQFNFSWLHQMLANITNRISNNHWTFNAPWMIQNSYVFTLRPQQGNLLYPLYHAWHEKRSYIDIFVTFVCYFSVFAFIVSRVYAILTK